MLIVGSFISSKLPLLMKKSSDSKGHLAAGQPENLNGSKPA
jgi:hypothetical protein